MFERYLDTVKNGNSEEQEIASSSSEEAFYDGLLTNEQIKEIRIAFRTNFTNDWDDVYN